jgi:hypothetical protein
MDETNHFTLVEFEMTESASHPEQALLSITGYFKERQMVNTLTFDFTLDGVNWLRRQKIVDQEFAAEYLTTFTMVVSIEEYVSHHAKAVLGFMEDTNTVWCDLIKLQEHFSNRRLIG